MNYHKIVTAVILVSLGMFLLHCQSEEKIIIPSSPAEINVWYGDYQTFGKLGNTQRQINILGNINISGQGIKAFYTLNNNKEKNNLTLGSDLHRLAKTGDFNIDIDRSRLMVGENSITIFVAAGDSVLNSKNITVNYIDHKKWPLPFFVNWNEVQNILDVVEVIDGDWEITDKGIRTKFMYYDRILAFGDSSWRNYEVKTTVVFHDFTPPVKGPPTYNVSHVAIASRWPGHDVDKLQPNRKWYPLGATSEFRITSHYDSCRWRIFDGENIYSEESNHSYRKIEEGVKYKIKHRVEDLSENRALYSVKFWEADKPEPFKWDYTAVETSENQESGSALLLAHNTDVTFGNISVISIKECTNQ